MYYYYNYITNLNEGFYDTLTHNFDGKYHKDLSIQFREVVKNDKIKIFVTADENGLPNAFNAGGTHLYITKTTLKLLDNKELIAILLHEYGHKVYHHTIVGHIFSGITVLVCASIITAYLYSLHIITTLGLAAGLVLGKVPKTIIDKHFEYTADSYAARMGYKSELTSALIKLHDFYRRKICSRSNDKKKCMLTFDHKSDLFSTHPSIPKRLDNIAKTKMMSVIRHIVSVFALANKFGGK